jgi:hypothetical protein
MCPFRRLEVAINTKCGTRSRTGRNPLVRTLRRQASAAAMVDHLLARGEPDS